jgi:hypothetical protein
MSNTLLEGSLLTAVGLINSVLLFRAPAVNNDPSNSVLLIRPTAVNNDPSNNVLLIRATAVNNDPF